MSERSDEKVLDAVKARLGVVEAETRKLEPRAVPLGEDWQRGPVDELMEGVKGNYELPKEGETREFLERVIRDRPALGRELLEGGYLGRLKAGGVPVAEERWLEASQVASAKLEKREVDGKYRDLLEEKQGLGTLRRVLESPGPSVDGILKDATLEGSLGKAYEIRQRVHETRLAYVERFDRLKSGLAPFYRNPRQLTNKLAVGEEGGYQSVLARAIASPASLGRVVEGSEERIRSVLVSDGVKGGLESAWGGFERARSAYAWTAEEDVLLGILKGRLPEADKATFPFEWVSSLAPKDGLREMRILWKLGPKVEELNQVVRTGQSVAAGAKAKEIARLVGRTARDFSLYQRLLTPTAFGVLKRGLKMAQRATMRQQQ